MTLVWWTDECMGKRFPQALREDGLEVRTHFETYQGQRGIPDEEWLPDIARREWVIITQDTAIRRRRDQSELLTKFRARYVSVSSMTFEQQIDRFRRARGRLESLLEMRDRPAIFAIHLSDVKELRDGDWHRVKLREPRP